MKVNTKLIALLTALAAGNALAAYTPVNTEIKNTATATFTDPTNPADTDPNNPKGSSTSNEVITKVLPRLEFDVAYQPSAVLDTDATDVPANAVTGYTATASQGQTVAFLYRIYNNGNDTNTITLTSDTTGGVTGIKYIPVTDGAVSGWTGTNHVLTTAEVGAVSSATGQTSYTIPAAGATAGETGYRDVWMVYTLPTTVATGTVVGATPIGTGSQFNPETAQNVPSTAEQKDAGAPTFDDLWWQYNKVTVQPVGVVVGPKDDGNADNKNDTTSTPNPFYTNPATPNLDPTPDTIYPGGSTPTPGGTPVPQDEQWAGGVCAAATTTNVVTFTNTVTNNGGATDTFNLTATTTPAGVTTEFYKLDGTTKITATDAVAPNASFSFLVRLTYTGCPTADPTVTVKVTSTLDPNQSNETKDIVKMPAAVFGNATTGTNNPNDVNWDSTGVTNGVPNTTTARPSDTPGTTTSIPMQVKNTGSTPDTYTPTVGDITFTVRNPDGTTGTQTVTPVYRPDTNCDGVADSTTTTYTPTAVNPGDKACFVLTVDVPANAIPQTTPALQQTVTSTNGVKLTDTNDTLTIGATGSVTVAKFTQAAVPVGATPAAGSLYVLDQNCNTTTGAIPANGVGNPAGYTCNTTSYAPGVPYSYQILGKNNYTTAISNFTLLDDMNKYGTYFDLSKVTGSCSGTGVWSYSGNIAKCTYTTLESMQTATMTLNVVVK